eukprot:2756138-Amphidinium_carterae.1
MCIRDSERSRFGSCLKCSGVMIKRGSPSNHMAPKGASRQPSLRHVRKDLIGEVRYRAYVHGNFETVLTRVRGGPAAPAS